MCNTYVQLTNRKKCTKFYKVSYFVHSVRPQTQYTILLKVQTNSVHSIIFCIRCTHAQYTVSYFAQCASKLSTLCHILHTEYRGVCSAHKLSGTQHEWGWQRIWLQNNAKRTMLQRRCTVSSFLSQYEVISEPTFMKYCTLHCTVIALQLERERDALKLNNTTTANTLITADTPTVWSAC